MDVDGCEAELGWSQEGGLIGSRQGKGIVSLSSTSAVT